MLINVSSIVPKGIRQHARRVLTHPALHFVGDYYSGLGSCLMYHRVINGGGGYPVFHPWAGLSVDRAQFDEHLRYLSENFHCLDLPTAIQLLSDARLPRKSVIVTFDDGYKDNLTQALPVLEKYNVPATIYITTGLIDRISRLWWYELEFILQRLSELRFEWRNVLMSWILDTQERKCQALSELNLLLKSLQPREQERLMDLIRERCDQQFSYDEDVLTWDEVRELDRHPLITIGAHTKTHPVLSQLSQSELHAELRGSRERLEDELGHTVLHFSYPFG